MKKRRSPEVFRRDISHGLLMYVDVLNKHAGDVCINPDVLKRSANMVSNNKPYGKDSWGYEVDDLQFRVALPQKVIPADVGNYLNIHLDYKVGGMCFGEYSDAIRLLELNIVVTTEGREYISSWHFDRHVFDDKDDHVEPEDAHPLFHFQYGGDRLSELNGDLGRVLMLPAPRIGHPPMDVILAVDFVLSNFAGSRWKALREIFEYKAKIASSQGIYWKPYVEQIISWWGCNEKERLKGSSHKIWPNLI